jgi:hypothetical protein
MDIDQAVQSAKAFASKSLGAERTANIRLEEIESTVVDGKPVWLITLSSEHSNTTEKVVLRNFGILGADSEREYKVFTVTKDTGEVLSMKIRLLTTPGA